MTRHCDVAVIGAGVIGTAIAATLRLDGADVLLIDREGPAAGASSGNAGHIAVELVFPLADPALYRQLPKLLRSTGPLSLRLRAARHLVPWFLDFAKAAQRHRFRAGTVALASLCTPARADWVELLERCGLSDILVTRGSLLVFESRAALEAERRVLDIARGHGVAATVLDGDSVRALAPGVSKAVVGGFHHTGTAHVHDPADLVTGLADFLAGTGAPPLRAAVAAIEDHSAGVRLETSDGPITAGSVVVAAGVWSRALAARRGLRLPLIAERGYHTMMAADGADIALPVSSAERRMIVTPMRGGIRAAGFVEFAAPETPPDWRKAEHLRAHAAALLPGIDATPKNRWSGPRPTLPDYLPAIGRDRANPALIWATGHQHLGLTLAATTARQVAALVRGERPDIDLTPFDPARFG